MVNDGLKLTGALTFIKNGKVVQKVENNVVNNGKIMVAKNLFGTADPVTHMGLGTGTTASVDGDIGLETPSGARISVTPSLLSNEVTYEAVWGVGGGSAFTNMTEAGLFNHLTNTAEANFFARTTFDPVSKADDDTLTIQWKITVS